MKTHTSSFKEQIKLMGKEIDSRITFGGTVLGKDDLNAVTPSYQGAILKSVMKQLDIDSNVEIPIGTILKYEFGLKVNGEYEYINYGNYIVYSIEKQEDTNSYKIVCYDKLLYSMLDYVKLPITYPISIRDYINAISTALGLKFANKSGTFANYNKQIKADLYDGLGYTFRDVLDELAQVTASTICLNNNDELEIRYITETGDTIDEEFLKDVNVNFGEKFGKVNTIVLSRSADSDSVYYPSVLPANPYEIKISDNQIMNGNDRADFLPDIYNKLNGLEFYTNDFVSTGICYYDLCDRYSVKVGDNTYSCVMFNDEVLVTQGLEENIYTELPEQTETDYKHASKDDRMINQVYIIAKKNEAEILAVVNTTKEIQKEINPTKDESGSEITIEDASNNPLTYLEIEGKSTQKIRKGYNKARLNDTYQSPSYTYNSFKNNDVSVVKNNAGGIFFAEYQIEVKTTGTYTISCDADFSGKQIPMYFYSDKLWGTSAGARTITQKGKFTSNITFDSVGTYILGLYSDEAIGTTYQVKNLMIKLSTETATEYEEYGVSPSPEFPSEIESVGYENLWNLDSILTNDNETEVWVLTDTPVSVPAGTYTFSGIITGSSSFILNYKYADNLDHRTSINSKATITFTEEVKKIAILLNAKSSVSNIQLEKGEIVHPYIPYGKYGVEVKTVGENLLENIKPTGTTTANGLNFVVNDDKTILVNGISTQQTTFLVSEFLYNNYGGKYVKGAPSGSSSSGYCLLVSYYDENSKWKAEVYDKGNGVLINGDYPFIQISILIRNGITVKNQIFKPMIVDNIDTEYKPYQKNTSVIVLNEPLRSLPNGVKDMAYIRNNKLYVDRYVGYKQITATMVDSFQNKLTNSQEARINKSTIGNVSNSDVLGLMSNTFKQSATWGIDKIGIFNNAGNLNEQIAFRIPINENGTYFNTHPTYVHYELAIPVTEELGEIEMPSTFKGINHISTTDELLPIINLTYVRDTVIADYVENHVTELKLTENEIKASVESVSSSVDGLNTTINRVEEITNDNSQVINVISTNIDRTSGEVREVTTTTGFTFNADGMTIDDGSGFKAEHTANGTYYKDGNSIVGQYTKDGSKQKDLELFGTYSYGKESIDDTPMFVGQLYTDANGERGFGHFYNGEG